MIEFQTIANSNRNIKQNTDAGFVWNVVHRVNHDPFDLVLIHCLQGYPTGWGATDELFDTLSVRQRKMLQQNKNTYFILNGELEGYNHFNYIGSLYYNCTKYHIPPEKVIYITANMDIEQRLAEYNKINKISNSIKVFPYMSFKDSTAWDYQTDTDLDDFTQPDPFEYHLEQVEKFYKDKYFLSLSRRTRGHRVILQYLLSTHSALHNKGIISQDKITDGSEEYLIAVANTTETTQWCKQLPIIADTADFVTNYANHKNELLQWKTLFQVVGETFGRVDDWSGMFYSEKTFKPIILMQPFLIAGQPNCNKRLEQHGFKLYHNTFDYSFDSIENTAHRYIAIRDEVARVTKELDLMSRAEQIDWRFKERDVLLHNRDTLLNYNIEIRKITNFLKTLK